MRKAQMWFLLADAARGRILRIPQHSSHPEHAPLETIFEVEVEHRPLREIMADAPGRAFATSDGRRSAMEYHSDPEREETRAFALSLVTDLEARRSAGDFDELVVCAPPRMLGVLREVMPDRLGAVVRSEVPKDFTKLPAGELRDTLQRLSNSLI